LANEYEGENAGRAYAGSMKMDDDFKGYGINKIIAIIKRL